jgi:hypothetical protein
MAFKYKPCPTGLTPCESRKPWQLAEAAALLGDTAVLGAELSFELRALAVNPKHPSKEGRSTVRQAFVLLQAMLVTERTLIEFLLGPALWPDQKSGEKCKRADDICVDCFAPDWRLPPGELADGLVARKYVINKLVAHATWGQVIGSPRQWTLTRIRSCVRGLTMFTMALTNGERSSAAAILQDRIVAADAALEVGRKDGGGRFDLVATTGRWQVVLGGE